MLGRVDAVAFTAGVGENAATGAGGCRWRAWRGWAWRVDAERNAVRSDEPRLISPEYARVAVAVVPTDEELEIAQQTYALVRELAMSTLSARRPFVLPPDGIFRSETNR